MKKTILSLAMLGAALLLTLPAQAYQETVNLRMGKKEIRGYNTINIKSLLRSAGYRVKGKELVSVTALAVSKASRRTGQYGSLSLRAGLNTSYSQTVFGDHYSYERPLPRDFQRVSLYAPYSRYNQAASNWQLIADGPLKIKQLQIVLEVNRRLPRKCHTDRHGRYICDGRVIDRRTPPRTGRHCTINRRGQRVCSGSDRRDDRSDRSDDRRRDDRSDRRDDRGRDDRGSNDRGNDRRDDKKDDKKKKKKRN